mmetsp:Transcript_67783/g.195996  ORF Transcript_67783/g.195996 Transcript_67783/m.195996 type:complete len:243 (-) Transcript_67783:162-890(-)
MPSRPSKLLKSASKFETAAFSCRPRMSAICRRCHSAVGAAVGEVGAEGDCVFAAGSGRSTTNLRIVASWHSWQRAPASPWRPLTSTTRSPLRKAKAGLAAFHAAMRPSSFTFVTARYAPDSRIFIPKLPPEDRSMIATKCSRLAASSRINRPVDFALVLIGRDTGRRQPADGGRETSKDRRVVAPLGGREDSSETRRESRMRSASSCSSSRCVAEEGRLRQLSARSARTRASETSCRNCSCS